MKTPHKIWLQSVRDFRGEDVWKCWHAYTDTNGRAYLYYKLTYEPKGSGELTKALFNKQEQKMFVTEILEMACLKSTAHILWI